jgi:hypothetical protein
MRRYTLAFIIALMAATAMPAGTYTVQALLHATKRSAQRRPRREDADGPRRGTAVGACARQPVLDAGTSGRRSRTRRGDRRRARPVIPPIAPPADTKYIRHERIQSELLTRFWGRPMHLGANVLLPEGWDTHPEARYPLFIYHGHFPYTFTGFRETPPDPNLKPDFAARFNLEGYNRIQQQHAYQFYREWTGPELPARDRDRDSAPDAVLRRQLRGELGQQRPLR